jgi:hypothetical protein
MSPRFLLFAVPAGAALWAVIIWLILYAPGGLLVVAILGVVVLLAAAAD